MYSKLKDLNRRMKPYKRALSEKLNVGLTTRKRLNELRSFERAHVAMMEGGLVDSIQCEFNSKFVQAFKRSRSQLMQDLFVLTKTDFKQNGYFVEFGATNGVDLSNTYLLEKDFNWDGILAEPAKNWHEDLKSNRTAKIETDCVWKESGKTLKFNETPEGELSTIDLFSKFDRHSRNSGNVYEVNTISLNDLLKKHNAPDEIDCLSIDTEGSEFEILSAFDFDAYNIKIITCEHNYTENRDKIQNLLEAVGYRRVLLETSKFDDWYVRE